MILLLALLVREWFVIAAVFPNPTQGDVSSYLRYAMHLVNDGVFSVAESGQPVVADAYRGPGYPFFLSLLLRMSGEESWIATIQQAQVLLGAITVLAVIALGRIAIGDRPALLAGAWMAFEPHNIAATGTVMTEVVFGCLLTLSFLPVLRTLKSGSLAMAMIAGVLLASAYLVNPIVALFPVLLLAFLWRRGEARSGLLIVAVMLVAIGGWEIRNRVVHAPANLRAGQNFVVGSWPDAHQAWKYQLVDAQQRATWSQIEREMTTLAEDPRQGFAQIGGRVAADPGRYAFWYLLQKPYWLWDWDIRFGAGGVNYLDTLNSPLDKSPLLHALVTVQQLGNPVLLALAACGILLALRWESGVPLALFFLYVTVVHGILQAEPRYSIPYKSVEILLAAGAIDYACRALSRYRQRAPAMAAVRQDSARSAG